MFQRHACTVFRSPDQNRSTTISWRTYTIILHVVRFQLPFHLQRFPIFIGFPPMQVSNEFFHRSQEFLCPGTFFSRDTMAGIGNRRVRLEILQPDTPRHASPLPRDEMLSSGRLVHFLVFSVSLFLILFSTRRSTLRKKFNNDLGDDVLYHYVYFIQFFFCERVF